jgi:hypothetical protein
VTTAASVTSAGEARQKWGGHGNGTETDINPGDAYSIPSGHDETVVGDVPFVGVDFSAAMASDYAKPS